MASFYNHKWVKLYHPDDIRENTRTVGFEFEVVFNKGSFFDSEKYLKMCRSIREDNNLSWTDQQIGEIYLDAMGIQYGGWGIDGSDKEIVSEPESITLIQKGGSARLNKLIKFLHDTAHPGSNSGTHIHIGKLPNDTAKLYNNILYFFQYYGEEAQKIFGRKSHWCKTPLEEVFDHEGEILVDWEFTDEDEIDSKGFICINRNHTFEFRGPKSSTTKLEILAWAEFCNNIVEICSEGRMDEVTFSEYLKGWHISRYFKLMNAIPNRSIMKQTLSSKLDNRDRYSYECENIVYKTPDHKKLVKTN